MSGRKITAKGVEPIGKVQWQFQATYLYGIVKPQTGASFFYEFSHLNTDCFQVFLNLVAEQFPEDLLIVQLDNGAFHKAKRLQVPDNIVLLFQPPHSPELNPIELAIPQAAVSLASAKDHCLPSFTHSQLSFFPKPYLDEIFFSILN